MHSNIRSRYKFFLQKKKSFHTLYNKYLFFSTERQKLPNERKTISNITGKFILEFDTRFEITWSVNII